MRVKIVVSYDGGEFNGWQKQPIGPPTVQGTLEALFERIFSRKIQVVGSGRTDRGVHAVAQVAHCELPHIPQRLQHSLNSLAPDGLVVKSLWEAPSDFHALASAEAKTYIYRIWNRPLPSVFLRNWALHCQKPLNFEHLAETSQILIGTQDFKSFQTTGTPVESTIRTISQAEWRQVRPGLHEFRIRGDGFLKQMVRNIVGTLLYMERKGLPAADLKAILAARDRQAAKDTAPPHGLYLLRVEYPTDLDNKCRKL